MELFLSTEAFCLHTPLQEVAHLQAVTPLVTSRAAVEKRKQRVQEEAARRDNKENEPQKKAKVSHMTIA